MRNALILITPLVLSVPAVAAAEDVPAQQDLELRLGAEVFSGFVFTNTEAEDFNEFDLTRAEIGADLDWGEHFGGEVRLEAIRSAGPQSLLGVDGDSLVLRVKRAWGKAGVKLGPVAADGRLGLIPDPWIDALQGGYDILGASQTLSERGLFFDTSDLGAQVRASAFDELVELRVAVTNGEGRNQREQNEGKNTTLVVAVRPYNFQLGGGEAVTALLFSYRDGSVGVGTARNHRLAAGLTFTSPLANLGVEFVQAEGYLGQDDLNAEGFGLWANAHVWTPWIGLLLRLDHLSPDSDDADNTQRQITAGLYSDLVEPREDRLDPRLRLYLLFQDESAGDNGGPIPGAPDAAAAQRVMFLLELGASSE